MRTVVVIFVVALVNALAAGCNDDEEAAPPRTTTRVVTGPADTVLARIPANVRRPFLRRCVAERGADKRFLCGCILVRLHQSLMRHEVATIAREGRAAPAGLRRREARAAKSCQRER